MRVTDDLADKTARHSIRHDTSSTLFVEAGAGSGKTSALVSRVQTLVMEGIPIDAIAAVTFTERAAADLRDQLRTRLEQASIHEKTARGKALAVAALEDLDLAAIGTLHSFARRILSEHPIEAGIPPLMEMLDEVRSSVEFDERWTQLRTALLDDVDMAPVLEIALAAGITLDHVRAVITKLNADWDLVAQHVIVQDPPAAPTLPDLAPIVARARQLVKRSSDCSSPADKFLEHLAALSTWADLAELGGSDADSLLSVLRGVARLKFSYGVTKSWRGHLSGIKSDCAQWQDDVAALVLQIVGASLRSLVHWCGIRVLEAAEQRRRDGRLEFHDLLVLARNLLRDNADVRAVLQGRYQRLLLDEFQDTDPIQIEIAVRIAGGAAAAAASWADVTIPPGSLFVVGDPKQSIYRFRRADIGMYLKAQEVIGGQVALTTNFRTVAPILDWVNAVFGKLIKPVPGMQLNYQALDASRGIPTVGAAVTVLGAEPHPAGIRADDLRVLEANDVAQSIVTALAAKWTTQKPQPHADKTPTWRPLRAGDITILVPARTSLPFLESALDEAGVLYRTESSSLVYHAAEVRDLFAAVRAIADPSDAFALVTALRSPLFGCGDDDLWTWKLGHGSFNLLAPAPEGQEHHPVGVAVAYLRRLHNDSRWLTPSEVLGRLTVDRRMFEVAVFGPRARDSWRRLRFVIDQARAWSEAQHGGLRAYLTWAAAQAAEGSRVAESVLPESDVDSVRIMTVHAAKGLEFPMVVMSGMTAGAMNLKGVQILWKDDGYSVSFGKDFATGDFSEQQPIDEQMSRYERQRLLYVAATRARDHLVVSLHHSGDRDTNARQLALSDAATGAVPLIPSEGSSATPLPALEVLPPPEFDEWLAAIQRSVDASRAKPALSASGLEGTDPEVLTDDSPLDPADESARLAVAVGLAKGARDTELPAWTKGRYGSAIGRAVHGAMQTVDLATGEGLEDAVRVQAVAEGVVEFSDLINALTRSALSAPTVQRASVRPHWRESYVGMVGDDGTVLEGFVDLIYREDDGTLHVVDYKTDAAPDGALARRVAYYAPQLRAYASVVETATGTPLGDSTIVFARGGAANEQRLT